MGLYTPAILGGNSYLIWFYDRGPIKEPAHTGTSKGLSQAINRGPIRKFLPKYVNVYVTIQGHDLSAGARTYYVTANGVRNGLCLPETGCMQGAWQRNDTRQTSSTLFHHKTSTWTENVKFRAVNVDLLAGTSNVHIPASI